MSIIDEQVPTGEAPASLRPPNATTELAQMTPDAAAAHIVETLTRIHGRLHAAELTVLPEGALARGRAGSQPAPSPQLCCRIGRAFEHTRARLKTKGRLLCAGEGAPVLGLALGAEGFETHVVLGDPSAAALGAEAARRLELPGVTFHHMLPDRLEFPAKHFHHAYSIGFLEHLDYPLKQQALAELSRCLGSKGLLSITFAYAGEVWIWGAGTDPRLRNRLATREDVTRAFLETGLFEVKKTLELEDYGEPPLDGGAARLDGGDRARERSAPRLASLLLRRAVLPEGGAAPALAPPPMEMSLDDLPATKLLSVVICTYRRPALLREALGSLLEQRLPRNRFEVIVVDNNSRDETEAVVRDFASRMPNLRYVHEPKQGLSHSRNRGCEEARGDYMVYLDDDARAHRAYLLNVYQAIATHEPDILGGPIYPYYSTSKPSWFKDEYEIRCHAKQTGWSTRCSISGSSFIIKRDLLRELGSFDPALGMVGDTVRLGEEKAVLKKYRLRPLAEQKVYYDLGCIVYHHVPREKMTSGYLLRRYYVAGYAKARIERMTRDRWSLLGRLRYAASCCRGRLAGMLEATRRATPRRRVKQYLLERGTGFMFEVGRFIGCFSLRRGERLTDVEGPEGS